MSKGIAKNTSKSAGEKTDRKAAKKTKKKDAPRIYEVIDNLSSRAVDLLRRMPDFEQRIGLLDKKITEALDKGIWGDDCSLVKAQEIQLETLRFYNESFRLAKEVFQILYEYEMNMKEKRAALGIVKAPKKIQIPYIVRDKKAKQKLANRRLDDYE